MNSSSLSCRVCTRSDSVPISQVSSSIAAVGQERRWLRREHALFSQESLHAFGGLGLQSMDESKDLACAGARQALADHDLEPSFLAGQSVRSLRVPAVDADRLQRAALRLPEVVECWNGRDALMSLASKRAPMVPTCRLHVVILVARSNASTVAKMRAETPYDRRAANWASRY